MQPRSIVAQIYVRGAAGNRVPAAHAPPGEKADLFQIGLEKFHLASAKLFAFPGTEVPVGPAAPTGRERRIPGNREPPKPLPAAAPSARLRLPARAGQGTPGHPRFPLRPQSEQTPARRSRGFLGRPGSSGAARRRAARGCLTGKSHARPGALGKAAARGGASAEPGRPRSLGSTTHAPGGSAITDSAGGYRLGRGKPGLREREGNLAAAARALPVGAPQRVGPGSDARRAAGRPRQRMRASGAGGGGEGREGEERGSSGEFGGVGWGRAPAAPGAAGSRGRGGSRSLRPGRRQSPRSESRFVGRREEAEASGGRTVRTRAGAGGGVWGRGRGGRRRRPGREAGTAAGIGVLAERGAPGSRAQLGLREVSAGCRGYLRGRGARRVLRPGGEGARRRGGRALEAGRGDRPSRPPRGLAPGTR